MVISVFIAVAPSRWFLRFYDLSNSCGTSGIDQLLHLARCDLHSRLSERRTRTCSQHRGFLVSVFRAAHNRYSRQRTLGLRRRLRLGRLELAFGIGLVWLVGLSLLRLRWLLPTLLTLLIYHTFLIMSTSTMVLYQKHKYVLDKTYLCVLY